MNRPRSHPLASHASAGRQRVVVILAIAGLLLAAGCGSGDEAAAGNKPDSKYSGVVLGEPTNRPQFTLTDLDGNPFDFYEQTDGKLTFLFFGYTNCPDVCPVHMAQLSEILARPGMPSAKVIFVTADPTRDTPRVMEKFLGNFDPEFIGLTGTEEEIRAAEKAAGVPPAQFDTEDGKPDPDGDYTVSHAGQVLAFAPDNRGYTVYPFGTRTSQYSDDIPLLAAIKPVTGSNPDGGSASTGEAGATSTTEPTTQWGGATLGDLTISDARAPEPTGPNGALYFTITNEGAADRLLGATTQSSPDVQLHETVEDGGATSMKELPDGVEVPAEGTVRLEPGGTHAMLMDVKRVESGSMMPVTLTFEKAGELNVLVPVVPVTEATR